MRNYFGGNIWYQKDGVQQHIGARPHGEGQHEVTVRVDSETAKELYHYIIPNFLEASGYTQNG